MQETTRSKTLLRLGLFALIIRFSYFILHASSPFFEKPLLDQHYYDLCARQLAGEGSGIIDGFRPLLYPLFASLFYRIDLGSGMLLTILAQHLMGIGMAMLVACVAMRLFDSTKAGFIAGLLFCLSAPPLYFEGELLIETLFSFLLLLLWMVIFRATQSLSVRSGILLWLLSGIVLGLAVQARPNALPLLLIFPLISLYRFIRRRKHEPSRTAGVSPAFPLLALVGLLGVQALFGAVNAQYSGQFSLLTQAGGINFYLGNSLNADGMIPRQSTHVVYEGEYRDPIQVMAEQGYRTATGETGPLSQKAVSDFWKEKTIEEIKTDPGRWIKLMLKKSWLILWNHEVPNNRSLAFAASEETPLLGWLPVHWWMLLALFPWGIAALKRNGRTETVAWISAFFVLFSATLTLFFINSRFRVPLWPGMAILGGGGAVFFWDTLKTRRIIMAPAIASIMLVILSTINWFGIPPDPIENDLSMRASAYLDNGQYDKALADIEACLEIAPNNPRYYFLKGNILLANQRNEGAVPAYIQAIALNPKDPMFHNNLGIAFENLRQPENALIAYRKALLLHPRHKAAQTNLILLLVQRGELDAAEDLISQIPLEHRSSAVNCGSAVLVYKRSGDLHALEQAKEINSELTDHLLQTHHQQ